MVAQPFRCFLIGGNTLLMACAERLLGRGHQLLGMVSDHPRILEWAEKHNIPCHSANTDYTGFLAEQPFDFLFSITHLAIIPAAVLTLPTRGTINFHDGPLPQYAGLNTPIWALLEGATQHGITWHLVTSDIDRGDILHQVCFDLEPEETALTLNARCFDEGLRSFDTVIDGLADDSLLPRAQNRAEFRYFGGEQRPPQAAVLDWHLPASDLARTVRALDFGRYPNPLTTAKIRHGGQWWIVRQASVSSNSSSGSRPGTVIQADGHALTIACAEDALTIKSLTHLDGTSCTLAAFIDRHDLQVGLRLDPVESTDWASWQLQLQQLAKHERYWLRRLRALGDALPAIPTAPSSPPQSASPRIRKMALPNPLATDAERTLNPGTEPEEMFHEDSRDWLIALLAVVIGRLHERARLSLGWLPAGLNDDPGSKLYSTRLPLTLSIDANQPFSQVLKMVARQRKARAKRFSFALDLAARHPDLNAATVCSFPVVVADQSLDLSYQPDHTPMAADSCGLLIAPESQTIKPTDAQLNMVWRIDTHRYDARDIERLAQRLQLLWAQVIAHPQRALSRHSLLLDEEIALWNSWNQTAEPRTSATDPILAFETQAAAQPNAVALVDGPLHLSFATLNARANQLARYLVDQGAGPGTKVGVHLERGASMVIAALATMKCGAAYLPLDPSYPSTRLRHMITDSGTTLVLTNHPANTLFQNSDGCNPRTIHPQRQHTTLSRYDTHNLGLPLNPHRLAYLIYTSGSTGTPKGVMVTRDNLANFALAMNRQVSGGPGDTWLAVTSLSFDISVLELWWTLANGFKVVLLPDRAKPADDRQSTTDLQFSLFYFSSSRRRNHDEPYRLLLEGAKYADAHGFSAVWTPERHFHDFGGLYANPAITGAAVATVTQRLQIRAGSVVLPLHHPVRVAEAWSMVDNLSGGRVGVSFASGWQPKDFILQPQNHGNAKEAMFRDIDTVQRLWRGEAVTFPGPDGGEVRVQSQPRPKQAQLPVWITTAGNMETYRRAGEIGANLLTHLLGQHIDELAPKIAVYREARAKAGFDPQSGTVSLMLHTFLGESEATVRATVWEPLKGYLASSLSLLQQHATTFPAFKQTQAADLDDAFAGLSEADKDAMLEHACDRYFRTSGLFGTVDQALALVRRLQAIGVNDVACLIDFGVPEDEALQGLALLNQLRQRAEAPPVAVTKPVEIGAEAVTRLLKRHQVSHLQATPSFVQMLMLDPNARAAIGNLTSILVGGEAWPATLAETLLHHGQADLRNMYGPTETTVWSSVARVTRQSPMTLGRPVANTGMYVVNSSTELVSEGQAGELLIGGAGVTRGYLGRPALTATRFICDPFSGQSGARLYRTGDRVRWQQGGGFEFLGRLDFQVKIRGFRIELGEIEAALQAHPHVRQCAVVARPLSKTNVLQIVAYVVSDGDGDILADVRAGLPDFMVPARLVRLPALPLTPNGKIDRKALPDPGQRPRATPAIRPENPNQMRVAEVWQRILERADLGIDDNFFDMGGDSLLVVGVHQCLQEAFPERTIQLTDLYRFTTIRRLAEFLTGEQTNVLISASADRGQRRRRAALRRR